MTAKPENPPAFPVPPLFNPNTGDYLHGQEGMLLRDWFAGQALAGMMANIPGHVKGLDWRKNIAREAYACADAMLNERTKPNG